MQIQTYVVGMLSTNCYVVSCLKTKEATVIVVPISKKSRVGDAAKVMKACTNALWVGLNRGENAGIAAVEILNAGGGAKGQYSGRLNAFRERVRQALEEADERERSKI